MTNVLKNQNIATAESSSRSQLYPNKTPYEVNKIMTRVENSKKKPLLPVYINGIDSETREKNRIARRERDARAKEATIIKKAQLVKIAKAASHVMCYRAYIDSLVGK